MSNRLSNAENEYFENTTAVALRMQNRIRRLVYQIDDPDLLADLIGLASDAARIRELSNLEKTRRKAERGNNESA